MNGGGNYHNASFSSVKMACNGLLGPWWGLGMRPAWSADVAACLAGQNAHKSLDSQQGCCVVAQVGARGHDGIDLFDCGLWLGLGGYSLICNSKSILKAQL